MPAINSRHKDQTDNPDPSHEEWDDTTLDYYGHPNTLTGTAGTIGAANAKAVEENFWHLNFIDPNEPVAADGTVPVYEPLQMDELQLPQKVDVALGPAAACAATCKEQAKLRETECDKLRARVILALKEGHCPSKITGIRKMPCGGGTKKKAPKRKATKSKK
jgi:hypothetical protein